MNFKISILVVTILIIMASLFAGCYNSPEEKSNDNPIIIEDDMGDKVEIPENIENIISLAPSITEILFSLEQGDKIVGRDSGSNYPSEAENIEIVSTYEGIDIEKIISKEPDIIFMDKTLDFSEINYNKMLEYDLVVFRVYPQSLQDVIDNIILLGQVTKTELKAQELVDSLDSRVGTVQTRSDTLTDSIKPKVLYVIYYDGSTSPWVGTTSTFSGDLIEIAGGYPAVEDYQGKSIQITVERFIELDPDIILTSQDNTWPTPSRESILNDEKFNDLKAVKNEQVIDVNADLVDRPGPRLVDGLELISGYITS